MPTAREMAEFLELVQGFNPLLLVGIDVEVDSPVISCLGWFESIVLQRIDDTFILPTMQFVSHLSLTGSKNLLVVWLIHLATSIGILEVDSGRTPLKLAGSQMNFTVFSGLNLGLIVEVAGSPLLCFIMPILDLAY